MMLIMMTVMVMISYRLQGSTDLSVRMVDRLMPTTRSLLAAMIIMVILMIATNR